MTAFFGKVLYPLYHGLRRDGVNRARRELMRSQWFSSDVIRELQNQKLSKILKLSQQNVPYYRRQMVEIPDDFSFDRPSEILTRMPILTKKLVRENQDDLVSTVLSGNKLYANSTSGSTGEPIRFFTDRVSMARRAATELRSDSWTGWQIGDPYVRLWGAARDFGAKRSLRSIVRRKFVNSRVFSSFDMTPDAMDRYVSDMLDVKPLLLIGYPGPLETFATHIASRNLRVPSLLAIVSSAETLWDHQRITIESAFGVPVFDRYGSREVGQIASECEYHNGLHISSDRVYLEVLDDEDNPCSPGVPGRIVVTDLDNFGMPLIRYDIGDRGVMGTEAQCECGRGLPKLERIEGRTLDIIRTPNGNSLGGTFWTLLLRGRPGFLQFQVIQEKIEGITVNYVRESFLTSETLKYFENQIKESCGNEFNVEFVEKESIDLTTTGKQRIVISKLEQDQGTSD